MALYAELQKLRVIFLRRECPTLWARASILQIQSYYRDNNHQVHAIIYGPKLFYIAGCDDDSHI
jgi:hypothetical protein